MVNDVGGMNADFDAQQSNADVVINRSPSSQIQPQFSGAIPGTSCSGLSSALGGRQGIEAELANLHMDDSLFCEIRHKLSEETNLIEDKDKKDGALSRWRNREKLKTQAAALVLCLNLGVDPPDIIKVSPCARLECWIDPNSQQATKSIETIGKTLQAQYERWQPKAKYKCAPDPTVEDVKRLCSQARRTARHERVLFHYNGHGVPRPTPNGEIWVFNKQYTQYIPLSVFDLHQWVGQPAIYVLDCSHAGLILDCLKGVVKAKAADLARQNQFGAGQNSFLVKAAEVAGPEGAADGKKAGPGGAESEVNDPMKEVIMLAACGSRQLLPQDSDLCADIFTACLTTPIKAAMRWFISRTSLRHDGVSKELIDRIPGRQTDRKTLLGELNWIFTAITDTIAWNVLPRSLFQKLFRQDLLVASLFRNFMLAERIMLACGCLPISYPRLPPMHQHPMWESWDMTAESCLMQLPVVVHDESKFRPSNFFSEQLTAFELWLRHGSRDKRPPEQLPVVLQVLLSQVHRLRALKLLGRFLDMGAWTVDLALSVGIFPYVLKLLQTTLGELQCSLVFIWCKILAQDKSCQQDLVKDQSHTYFLKILQEPPQGEVTIATQAQAAFILAAICDGFPIGQQRCFEAGLLDVLMEHLHMLKQILIEPERDPSTVRRAAFLQHTLLLKWVLLALGKLWDDQPIIVATAITNHNVVNCLHDLIGMSYDAEVRSAAVFALGSIIDTGLHRPPDEKPEAMMVRLGCEQQILSHLLPRTFDGSPLVRTEVAVAISRAACVPFNGGLSRHNIAFTESIDKHQQRVLDSLAEQQAAATAMSQGTSHGSEPASPIVHNLRGRFSCTTLAQSSLGPITRDARSDGHLAFAEDSSKWRMSIGMQYVVSDRNSVPGGRSSLPTGILFPGSGRISHGRMSHGSEHANSTEGTVHRNKAALPLLSPHVEEPIVAAARGQISDSSMSMSSMSETSTQYGRNSGLGMADVAPGHPITAPVFALPKVAVGNKERTDLPQLGEEAPRPQGGENGSPAAHGAPQLDASTSPKNPDNHNSVKGLYDSLVDALCMLATDPAPQVAKAGRMTLQSTGHDIAPVMDMAPGLGQNGAAVSRSQSTATNASMSAALSVADSARDAPLMEPNTPSKGIRWTNLLRTRVSDMGRTMSSVMGTSHTNTAAPPALPPPTPATVPSTNRERCMLTPMPHILANTDIAHPGAWTQTSDALSQQQIGTSTAPTPLTAATPFSTSKPWTGLPGVGDDDNAIRLPASAIYALSCEHFRMPMLDAQKGAWRSGFERPEAPVGIIDHLSPVAQEKAAVVKELVESIARCRAAAQPRLTENVATVDTGQNLGISAITLHPWEPLLTAVDVLGIVHVMDHTQLATQQRLNCFHVVTGAPITPLVEGGKPPGCPPCSVVAAYIVNGAEHPLLMACAADGAVRIWRRHVSPGQQKLVSAWQSVDIDQSAAKSPDPAAFLWSASQGTLFSVGGLLPANVFAWDLRHECVVQTHGESHAMASSYHSPVYTIDYLAGPTLDPAPMPLLIAGCSDGVIRIFDVRDSRRPAAHFKPHQDGLQGIAFRAPQTLVTASATTFCSELCFNDIRMASDDESRLQGSVVKRVEAHSKGGLTALAAHPYAPLFATGTVSQVVKIWSDSGEHVSSIRAHPRSSTQRLGPITCLSFQPHDLKLASGAQDPVCAVYTLDDSPRHESRSAGSLH